MLQLIFPCFLQELNRPGKLLKVENFEDDYVEDESKRTIKLYGKWQLEPLRLPRAVDGKVPKVLLSSLNYYFD